MSGQSHGDSSGPGSGEVSGERLAGRASSCWPRTRSEFLLLGLWTILVAGLFWPFWSGQNLVGYRDAVQFYWPMFQWADEVWAAGEAPYWNPYEGLGRSHLAEGVSSLFYPGKLIFWARWVSFESRLGCYQAIHVWLAGWGAAWLAGLFGAQSIGRGVAMLMYGLAGPTLFASTNVVYLVSAAWLPWGLGAVWLWQQPRSWRWSSLATAVSAALMVLGGDPQMAGNLLLIALGSWSVWSWRAAPAGGRWRALSGAGVNWLGVCLLMAGLAAVQIGPSGAAATGSERTGFLLPRTFPEWIVSSLSEGTSQPFSAIFGEPKSGTHLADVYEFSQPPWTVVEWIWPGVSGRPFPVWTHWSSSLPGAGRMWQPSLYQGAWCLFLACGVVRCREVRWLVILGGLSAAAACGWYGPVWLFNELGLATGWWEPLDGWNRGLGGIYWWLVSCVPGFVWFRYPAKLITLTSLVLAILAGRGLTCLEPRRWGRWMLGLAGSSLLLLWGTSWIPWERIELAAIGDEWFGPLDSQKLRWELMVASLHTFVFSLLGWWLWSRRREVREGRLAGWLGLGVLAADLALGNHWLVAPVSQSQIRDRLVAPPSAQELKVYWNAPASPPEWRTRSSEKRLEEVVAWEIEQAFPRLHWLWGERQLNAPATIEQKDWLEFLDWVYTASMANPEVEKNSENGVLSWQMLFDSKQVWQLSNPRGEWLTGDNGVSAGDCVSRFREGRVSLGTLREDAGLATEGSGWEKLETVGEVTSRTSQTLTVRVSLQRPGVVFLSEGYAPGWQVIGQNLESGQIWRRDCLSVGTWLRGVELESGEYELEFVYTPPGLYLTKIVSLLCWAGVFCLAFRWETSKSAGIIAN